MNHRVTIVAICVLIVAAIVGGVVYVEWPRQRAPQGSSAVETMQKQATATSSILNTVPNPAVGPPSAESAQQELGIIGTPRVRPLFISAIEPTPVTVEIEIPDPGYISGSANLQRLDVKGKVIAVLGTLHDDGLNGDVVAGDKIFTLQTTLNEERTGEIRFQVSAAFKGLLKRVASTVVGIRVNPSSDPEQVLEELVANLRAGDIESALGKIALPPSRQAKFKNLSQDSLNRLADAVAQRRLLEADQHVRTYVGLWVDDSGVTRDLWITLARNPGQPWQIVSW